VPAQFVGYIVTVSRHFIRTVVIARNFSPTKSRLLGSNGLFKAIKPSWMKFFVQGPCSRFEFFKHQQDVQYFLLIYFNNKPLNVSSRLAVHHQEDQLCKLKVRQSRYRPGVAQRFPES
jgi:hypothetical protein